MEVIDFNKLYECDFNIFGIIAKRQHWKNGEKFFCNYPRSKHGFLFLNACTGTIALSDKVITAHAGSLVYLPKNTVYNVTFSNCEKNMVNSYIVSFDTTDVHGCEIAFSDTIKVFVAPRTVKEKMTEAAALYEQLHSCPSQIKICMYTILKSITVNADSKYLPKDYRIIKKGIDYINQSFDDNPNIGTAAKLCSVSTSHFRRVFKKYNGTSPKEYILDKKIEKAKEMLKSGLYTVSEISDVLKFSTPAYFTVVFKKKTGCTPSQYATCDIPHLH